MPIKSKLEAEGEEGEEEEEREDEDDDDDVDGRRDVTHIGKSRSRLAYHRSFPFLRQRRKKAKKKKNYEREMERKKPGKNFVR